MNDKIISTLSSQEEEILPIISEKIHDKLTAYHKKVLSGVVQLDMKRMSIDFLDLGRAKELINRISYLLAFSECNILEIGSGCGSVVGYINRGGVPKAFGIEPNNDYVSIAQDVQNELGTPVDHIIKSVGEYIPFASNSMDLVTSVTVYEHVQDPLLVLQESIRVLKPGGYLHFTFPNYGSFWDGHYAILWIPHIPKKLAKLYILLLGRDPDYVDGLQLIDYKMLKSIVDKVSDQVEVITYGEEIWEQRLQNINIENYGHLGKLKKWVEILHKLQLIKLIIWLGKKAHWVTPFVLIMRKKL